MTRPARWFVLALLAVTSLSIYGFGPQMKTVHFRGIRAEDSKDPLRNLERGFRYEAFLFADNLQNPNRDGAAAPNSDAVWPLLKQQWSQHWSPSDSLTLSQQYIYLTEYVGGSISPEGLQNIQRVFDAYRAHGYKMLLRFAYDHEYGLTDATVTDIRRHLRQLQPLLQRNAGVIHALQAGFVGTWGEWHTSHIMNHPDSMRAVSEGLLEALPESRQLMMRLPSYKNELDLPDSLDRRIGYHNDYFVADQHKRAEGNDYAKGTPAYRQVLKESPFLQIDGEMPYAEDSEWGLNHLLDVTKTIKRLRDHHFTSFSIAHNYDLNVNHWKQYSLSRKEVKQAHLPLSDGYFEDGSGEPVERTAYEYIRDHLGYRIELQKAVWPEVWDRTSPIKIRLSLMNRGFSATHNPRPVYLVLIDEGDNVVRTVRTDADPGEWQPHAPGKTAYTPLVHTIDGSLPPEPDLKPGVYRLGLWMPDGAEPLRLDAQYAIRCANGDVSWWEDDRGRYGINVLGKIQVR